MKSRAHGQPYLDLTQIKVDLLMADLVDKLNQSSKPTRACCHGHIREGKIQGAYVSFIDSEVSRNFLNRISRVRFLTLLEWEVIGVLDGNTGLVWFPLHCETVLPARFKRFYRFAIKWDTKIFSLFA